MRRVTLVILAVAGLAVSARGDPAPNARLSLAFAEGIRTGRLVLRDPTSGATFTSKDGAAIDLPPGQYQVTELRLRRRALGDQKKDYEVFGYTHDQQRMIAVEPGESTLTLGGPFELRVEAIVWGPDRENLEIADAYLAGADDLKYRFEMYDGDFTGCLRLSVRSGGRTRSIGEVGYG